MTVADRRAYLRGLALSAGGMVILSPDALLLRLIAEADLWDVVCLRTLFSGSILVLGLALIHRRRLLDATRAMGGAGFLAVVLLAGSNIAFVLALAHTTVANTLVLLATTPLFSALVGWFAIGEPIAGRTGAAMAVALVGIGLIFWESLGGGHWLGIVFAVVVAATQGANLVVVRQARPRDMTPALALSGLLAAAVAAPWASPGDVTARDLGLLAVVGFIVLPLSFVLYLRGVRHVPAAEVGLLALIETALGPLWVWAAIGEMPSALALTGGAVVIAAIVSNALLALRGDDAAGVACGTPSPLRE